MMATVARAASLPRNGGEAVTWAAAPECAQSPGHVIKLCVSVQDGHATFEVSRLGKPIPVGLDFVGESEAHYGAITSVSRRSSDTSWEQP